MDAPLWTDAHAPDLSEVPQGEARTRLQRAVDEPMNLVVYGPPGAGKTAAVRALAREAHADPDNDFVEVNVSDFFDRSKSEIRDDPRFSGFLEGAVRWTKGRDDVDTKYKRNWSKRDMASHVLKETASYAPASGEYKTVLLDNAEAIREDFQQALRRVMEQYHRTAQFVIATRQPTRLIPPIRSRCFQVSMRAPTNDEVVGVLEGVVEREGVDHDPEGIEFVAGYADGDLRRALLAAQTVHGREGAITMSAAHETLGEVGLDATVESMLDAAEAGDFSDARSELDDLLGEEGLNGEEVLDEILRVARKRYSGDELARLHRRAGEIDFDLQEGASDEIHLSNLLAGLGPGELAG
ncbi:replication factor C small subunit 2 [Halobacteriales archaeon QS_8_69_26]|nr:MAG: replication factor C small subunit 2 [Halobacteriales archaeon QS_8_69_26]